jgi:hypothetical protein
MFVLMKTKFGDDEGGKFLQNVGNIVLEYTAFTRKKIVIFPEDGGGNVLR